MKKWLSMALIVLAGIYALGCIPAIAEHALPMIEDFNGGNEPNPNGYIGPYEYLDDSIHVKIEQIQAYDSIVWLVHVKISDPCQLRTTTAYYSTGAGRALPSRMARTVNAVVAINGDFYGYRDGSYIVRQGKRLRSTPATNQDQLVIDFEGNFHLITERNKSASLKELRGEIYQAFTFGPALVRNGEVLDVSVYHFETMDRNPRQAIGQLGELEYLLVCVDGRIPESAGITTQDLAYFMRDQGCVYAFNLDGGGSAAVIWRGEKINFSAEDERIVGDIVYFASTAESL